MLKFCSVAEVFSFDLIFQSYWADWMDPEYSVSKGLQQMQRTSEIYHRVGLKVEVTVKAIDDNDESGTFVYAAYFAWKIARDPLAVYPSPEDRLKPLLKPPEIAPHVYFQSCVSRKFINEVYYWGGELHSTNEVAYFGRVEWLVKIISRMNLTRFPYDRQKVRIILKASNCHFERMATYDQPASFPDQLAVNDSHLIWDAKGEWVVDTHTTELRYEHFSAAVTEICLARDPSYYICNIGTIMYIIVISGTTVIAMDVKNFHNRSSLLTSLLLSSVVLKLVTTNYIAIKSYLTYMDWYMLISVIAIMVLILESVIVNLATYSLYTLVRFDYVFMIVFATLWTLFHLVIWVGAYKNWFRRDWRLIKAVHGGVRKAERNHFIMRTRVSSTDFSEGTHLINQASNTYYHHHQQQQQQYQQKQHPQWQQHYDVESGGSYEGIYL